MSLARLPRDGARMWPAVALCAMVLVITLAGAAHLRRWDFLRRVMAPKRARPRADPEVRDELVEQLDGESGPADPGALCRHLEWVAALRRRHAEAAARPSDAMAELNAGSQQTAESLHDSNATIEHRHRAAHALQDSVHVTG